MFTEEDSNMERRNARVLRVSANSVLAWPSSNVGLQYGSLHLTQNDFFDRKWCI